MHSTITCVHLLKKTAHIILFIFRIGGEKIWEKLFFGLIFNLRLFADFCRNTLLSSLTSDCYMRRQLGVFSAKIAQSLYRHLLRVLLTPMRSASCPPHSCTVSCSHPRPSSVSELRQPRRCQGRRQMEGRDLGIWAKAAE